MYIYIYSYITWYIICRADYTSYITLHTFVYYTLFASYFWISCIMFRIFNNLYYIELLMCKYKQVSKWMYIYICTYIISFVMHHTSYIVHYIVYIIYQTIHVICHIYITYILYHTFSTLSCVSVVCLLIVILIVSISVYPLSFLYVHVIDYLYDMLYTVHFTSCSLYHQLSVSEFLVCETWLMVLFYI